MRLNELSDNPGATKSRRRVGRGIGSGVGKTAGRGGKGQTARAGVRINGFEGGQMPLYRRLPKRGFKNLFRRSYNEINLGDVQDAVELKRIDAGKPVTVAALVEAGILRRPKAGLRLLGDGELKVKLTFEVNHATKSAMAAVEKAGGSITIVKDRAAERPKKVGKRQERRAAGPGRAKTKLDAANAIVSKYAADRDKQRAERAAAKKSGGGAAKTAKPAKGGDKQPKKKADSPAAQ